MSDNWIVQNLENALETWNEKLSEIWQLITQSPENFKGGTIWNVIVNIHGAVQAIGLALLVLFFVVGVMRTCGSFAEVKKPEHALKLFIRFALAKGAVTYGLELMMALFNIVQGLISTIMNAAGFGTAQQTVLPSEIVTAVEDCGFFESIPLWAVTLIGGLFITVLSFIMIMSVYGRFFKLYLYTAIAPVPLSTFAGEPSQSVGKSFIKSYAAVCLEGAIIVLACIIFSLFAASPPAVDPNAAAVSMVWPFGLPLSVHRRAWYPAHSPCRSHGLCVYREGLCPMFCVSHGRKNLLPLSDRLPEFSGNGLRRLRDALPVSLPGQRPAHC